VNDIFLSRKSSSKLFLYLLWTRIV